MEKCLNSVIDIMLHSLVEFTGISGDSCLPLQI